MYNMLKVMPQYCNAQFKAFNTRDSREKIACKSLGENKNHHLRKQETNTTN